MRVCTKQGWLPLLLILPFNLFAQCDSEAGEPLPDSKLSCKQMESELERKT